MIPAEAVEAAAHALFEKELGRPMEVADEGLYAEDIVACREDARAALEAAAPHMLGDAYDLGFEHGSNEPANPYRTANREHLEQFRDWEPGDPIE